MQRSDNGSRAVGGGRAVTLGRLPPTMLMAVALVSGCAETTTVYHLRDLAPKKSGVLTVDAKQRHLLVAPATTVTTKTISADGKTVTETVVKTRRTCAEAAPDVFSAIAGSGNLKLGVDAKSAAQVDLAGGLAVSETAAEIRRTQTINVARESFYRTCERYMSGAIGETAFGVQAARDFRLAVALLSIEQLTGAIAPAATIISGPSTSATEADSAAFYKELKVASDELATAKATATAADAAAADDTAPCKAPATETDAAKATRLAECTGKKTAATAAKQTVAAAQLRYDGIKDVGKSGAAPGGQVVRTGGGTSAAGAAAAATTAATVAQTVERIAREAMATDETLMFCLQALSGVDPTLATATAKGRKGSVSVQDKCLDYMGSKVDAETAVVRQLASRRVADFQSASQRLAAALDSLNDADFVAARDRVRTLSAAFCKRGDQDLARTECVASLRNDEELLGISDLEGRLRQAGVKLSLQ